MEEEGVFAGGNRFIRRTGIHRRIKQEWLFGVDRPCPEILNDSGDGCV